MGALRHAPLRLPLARVSSDDDVNLDPTVVAVPRTERLRFWNLRYGPPRGGSGAYRFLASALMKARSPGLSARYARMVERSDGLKLDSSLSRRC